jgi:two-component system sensor histidine kinase CiaH
LKQLGKQQNIRFFVQYVLSFALIFGLLGFIVISVLNATAYRDVDAQLEQDSKKAFFFFDRGGDNVRVEEIEGEGSQRINNEVAIGYATDVLFWTADKKLITSPSPMVRADVANQIHFNDLVENSIQELKFKDTQGEDLYFHSIMVPFRSAMNGSIAYMQIMSNTNQIRESVSRFKGIVIWCMVGFWLVSILISVFLARLAMRPLLIAWKKQQEFVENASHELRTPLAIIQNKLEMIFTKPESTIVDNSEAIAQSLAEIRHLRHLTTDLLTLARRDGEQLLVDKETLEIIPFFEQLTSDYAELAKVDEKKLIFTVVPSDNFSEKIETDKKLLQQLVVILLDNALKYTAEGGQIDVNLGQTRNELIFSVKDTGVGIPDDLKATIFERFVRVESSRNRSTGGFGLGLSIAKQILDALHGKIVVLDNLPKGTTFKVTLPK